MIRDKRSMNETQLRKSTSTPAGVFEVVVHLEQFLGALFCFGKHTPFTKEAIDPPKLSCAKFGVGISYLNPCPLTFQGPII